MELKDQLELERQKAAMQMFVQNFKDATQMSIKALSAVLWANGGAAMICAAYFKQMPLFAFVGFGIGTFLAILALFLGYMANYNAAESWRRYIQPAMDVGHDKTAQRWYERCQYGAVAFGGMSLAAFIATLIVLVCSL